MGRLSIALSFLLLIFVCANLYSRLKDTEEKLTRSYVNVGQLESDNYQLSMDKDELTNFISEQNTEFKQKIDSVTKDANIKIKDLQTLVNTKTVITVKDTVFLAPNEVKMEVDSLYVLKFLVDSACYKVDITAHSIDPNTTIRIDELEMRNESFFMAHYEKKKWWQFFKKRKVVITTVNSCGNTETRVIQVEK